MSFNYLGMPTGSALAGLLAGYSIEGAVAFGALASVIAGAIALVFVPRHDEKPAHYGANKSMTA